MAMPEDHARRLRALADPAPGRVLHALCALGVPDALVADRRTAVELAEVVGAAPDPLRRVLRAAAGLDVVAEDAAGRWGLLPAGELLRSDVPGSLHAEFGDNDLFALWARFLHSVRTGEPCYPVVFGSSLFDRLASAPDERASFHRHMHSRAHDLYRALVPLPVWPSTGVLVDVCGGTGGLLEQLLAANPGLSGVLVDRPEVLELSPLRRREGVRDRVRFEPGDVFTDVLPRGDVHLLAAVLHDWPDDRAAAIVAACRAAAAPGGRLLVVDRVLPPRGPHPGHLNDLLMLAACGGRERTRAEWEALLGDGGFEVVATHEPDGSGQAVVECVAC